jgi:3-oxoadipate enol-lactonase
MERIKANGIRIACRFDGSAESDRPWIVFSHSLACDHTMWDEQAKAFADFRVLSFDTRGHGASEVPPGDYTLEMMAADLLGVLDALAIERCHFVGLSMGGMIGMQFALRYPNRFESLTLADTTSRYPPAARAVWDERLATVRAHGMNAVVPATLERWFTPEFRRTQPDTVARIAQLIRATPVEGFAACAYGISHINLLSRLPNIDCPTLVMVGDADLGTPQPMAEEIVRAIPGSRLCVIRDAGHLSNIEQPAQFDGFLRQFLARLS